MSKASERILEGGLKPVFAPIQPIGDCCYKAHLCLIGRCKNVQPDPVTVIELLLTVGDSQMFKSAGDDLRVRSNETIAPGDSLTINEKFVLETKRLTEEQYSLLKHDARTVILRENITVFLHCQFLDRVKRDIRNVGIPWPSEEEYELFLAQL